MEEQIRILKGVPYVFSAKYEKELSLVAQRLAQKAGSIAGLPEKIKHIKVAADWIRDFRPDSSIAYYKLLVGYATQDKDFKLTAQTYVMLGTLYCYREHYNESINMLVAAEKINNGSMDSSFYVTLYAAYSLLYGRLQLTEKTIFYDDLALQWTKESEKWGGTYIQNIITSVVHYARIFNKTHQRKYSNIADSRLKLIMEHVKEQRAHWYQACYYLKGYIAYSKGNYANAIAFLDSSMQPLFNQSSSYFPNNNFISKLYKGVCLVKTGHYLQGSQLLATVTIKPTDKRNLLIKYTALSEAAVAEGNYKKTFDYQVQIKQLSDSLDLEGQKGKVFEVEQKYSVVQNKAAIETLENKNLQEKNSKKEIALISLSIIFILVTLLLLLFLANKRQKVKQLLERRALIDRLQQMENNMQLQQLEKKTEIDKQRISISKDMHDEVSSGLASLRFFINDLQRTAKQEEAKTLLGKAGEEALHVYLQAKEFMNRLNKGHSEEKYNVIDFLYNLSGTFGKGSSLEINTMVDVQAVENNFTQTQHTETYRIIKEAVANAMKHADASKMNIELYGKKDEFHFSISDNGTGLYNVSRGMGLSSMEERAKLLGGQLSIVSDDFGTVIKGSFPLSQ